MAQKKAKAAQPVKRTATAKTAATRTKAKSKKVSWIFPLTKSNMIFIGIGLAIIVIGYLLMYTGVTEDAAVVDGTWNNPWAVSVAPMLLVIGYCIVIPIAILKLFKKDTIEE